MRSPLAYLRDLAGIRETEGTRLFLMAAYLLLVITCYTTTKAVRDSLFIIEIGPSQLPYLYVLTAVSMALISSVYPRALKRLGLSAFVQLTSLIAVASLLLFWSLVAVQGRASFYALYVWVSLFGAITASQAWSVASHVFDAREARRSFAWIALGGVVGGIVGGSLARVIAPWLGTEILLPICAALMGITVLILRRLAPRENREVWNEASRSATGSSDSSLAVFGQIRKSPYLSMMVALLVAGVLVEAFVDYEFKVVAHQAFDSKDRLTSFFGTIASYGGMLALLIQTLVTNRLLKRFGVGAAILFLPAALLAGFLLVSASPVLWAVSILKLIDGSLSYSVHRSGMELLYVPIPAKLRASVKALIDLLVDRAGRAAGGLLLLVLTTGLSLTVPSLSLVAVVALSVWLGIAIAVRRNYVHAFRTALERKVIEPEALEVGALHTSIVDTLFQALSSPDDRQVLYSLDLLGRMHPSRWHSYLPVLLQHRSPAIRSRTIALLTEWKEPSAALVTERLTDPELEVRVEAVRHLCVVASPEAGIKLKEFLVHADSRVVLAAIHCMGKYQLGDRNLIDSQLIEWALNTTGEHSISARTAAARALGMRSFSGAEQFLERLLREPEREVVQQAIRTAGEIRYEPAIPLLISMLARAPLRREARHALLKLGAPAVAELRRRLEDDQTPLEVRTRIPKVLAFSGDQNLADFLLGFVHRFGRQLDMKLLKAANRMHARYPDITFEPESVSALLRDECEGHRRLMQIRRALEFGNGGSIGDETTKVLSLMTKAIDERLAETVERAFRLLALIYSPADIQTVYFNFNVRPAFKASAVEFLDNLIDPELRNLVMPLVDDAPEKAAIEGETNDVGLHWEEAVQILLTYDDEWLRTIARELVARLKVDAWSPRIA